MKYFVFVFVFYLAFYIFRFYRRKDDNDHFIYPT